jgi:hypothetical protein
LAQEEIGEPEVSSGPVSAQELFWPIDAGTVPGDKSYPLKALKWWVKGVLTFGNTSKADYYLLMSKKSLVESDALANEKGDVERARERVSRTFSMMKKSTSLVEKAKKSGREIGLFHSVVIGEIDKEIAYFDYFSENGKEELRGDYASASRDLTELREIFIKL